MNQTFGPLKDIISGKKSQNNESKSLFFVAEAPFLPPCEVCNGKASGYHYGAITCNACKIFFRRSLEEKYVYQCKKEGKCEIRPTRRLMCSFCRLKKCHHIGMSKEGCFKGRYTLSRKADYIKLAKGEILGPAKYITSKPLPNSSCRPINVNGSAPRTPEQIQIYESIIKGVTEADTLNALASKEFLESLPEREAKVLEQKHLLKKRFGIAPVSSEMYREVYKESGLDIDGRREQLKRCLQCSEDMCLKYVGFLKSLPDFQHFTMNDKVNMTKSQVGFTCWYTLSILPCFNLEEHIYTCVGCCQTFTKEDFLKFNNEETIESYVQTLKQVRDLDLSPSESAMVKGLASLSSDCVRGLERKEDIERQERLYLEALVYLLEKTRPRGPSIIAGIFQFLVQIRSNLEERRQDAARFLEDYHDVIIDNISPVARAMMDDDFLDTLLNFKIE